MPSKNRLFSGLIDNNGEIKVDRLDAALDSAEVIALIDSAYVSARSGGGGGGVLSIDADENIFSSNTTSSITAGSGLKNIAIGTSAGQSITTGDWNVFMSQGAGDAITTGTSNVALGINSLGTASTSSYAVAIGYNAISSTTAGYASIGIGYQAGRNNGSYDIALGFQTHYNRDASSNNNITIGYQAGYAIKGDYNISIGDAAGPVATTYTATDTINIGRAAGQNVASGGSQNTINIGNGAGKFQKTNRIGQINIGSSAGQNCDQHYSINIGQNAGSGATYNTTNESLSNIHIGSNAGQGNTYGGSVVIGSRALVFGDAEYSVVIGNMACSNSSFNQSHSTVIGYSAGSSMTTGTGGNVIIGSNNGITLTSGERNILIGQNQQVSTATGYNQIVITTVGGNVGKGNNTAFIGAGSNYNPANTSSWNTTSDERVKKNITDYTLGLDTLNQINVKTYNYKSNEEIAIDNPELADSDGLVHENLPQDKTVVGLIAQELETVLPNSVTTRENGFKSMDKDELFWVMLNSIKELKARIEALENA